MSPRIPRLYGRVAALIAFSALSATGTEYTFKKIVDKSSTADHGLPFVIGISNNGLVAFVTLLGDGLKSRIYSSDGAVPREIAVSDSSYTADGGINSSGVIVCKIDSSYPDAGIYLLSAGSITPLVKGATGGLAATATINDHGSIAFTWQDTLMIASNGTIHTIAESKDKVGSNGRQPGPIDNQGRVVYADGLLLKVATDASVTTVTPKLDAGVQQLGTPSMNDAGAITLTTLSAGGSQSSIVVIDSSGQRTIASGSTGSEFGFVGGSLLTADGTVVFGANPRAGHRRFWGSTLDPIPWPTK